MKFKRIYVEITNKCNLNCSFCSKLKRDYREMSIGEFTRVINEIKGFTEYIYLHLKGEPLIYPYLENIFDIAENNNIKVNITTNGTNILKAYDAIKNSNCIRQINISLQAMERVADKDKYLDGVKKIIELSKIKGFYVSLRIWIDNEEVNRYIHNYFVSHKIDMGENVHWSYDIEFEWPDIDGEFVSEYGTCLGTKTHIGILANGDVVPCCLDGNGAIVFGNVFNESLKDILSSSRFIKMREGFNNNKLVEELCRKCKYRRK